MIGAEDLFFFSMVALLATHELDAIQNHEWRVLPLTSWLPEQTGRAVFLLSHIPLFFIVAWIVALGSASFSALLLSGFSILHVGLHWLFRNHPQYEFKGFVSNFLIVGAGVSGGAHLLVVALT